ncbi:unnamed protein product [Kuraishia capsulata CBS 1993]|uniref:Uncharacterized protein n=1 Tax=Kuraishia capsulata CBS 1993 TaxID=1382522 RepID=W6ML73_9ASCO|nr:uncharacterized protein KUCA_T00003217001 [Kuraishia capsulata CBS 1993]CDK27239.1 unnamed protein product [Kuraishia capsulata CBS 1993]
MTSRDLILDKRFRLFSFKLMGDATSMMDYYTKKAVESFRTKITEAILEGKVLLPPSAYEEALGAAEIRQSLKLKTREGQCQFNGKDYILGSLLFRSPHGLGQQSCIFLQRSGEKRGLLMIQVLPKLISTVIEFLTYDIGAFVKPVVADQGLLQRSVNGTFSKLREIGKLGSFGDIEFTFGVNGLQQSSLQNVLIVLPNSELKLFESSEGPFLNSLFQQLDSSTAVDFSKLQLVKIKCTLFNIFSNGKIMFTREMTSSPSPSEDEDRPSVWYILEDLLDTFVVKQ